MTDKKTTVFEHGLLWFGAAVSLAEILTGTYLAPLGFVRGLTAILLGHGIGCVLLFLAGVIGGKTQKSSMEAAKMSFGQKGSLWFAFLNVVQLVGWTAIMIYDGALAANGVFQIGHWVWALVIGGLILLWIMIGIQSLGKLNTVSMAGLFILTVILSVILFRQAGGEPISTDGMTFGAAVELSVAMPLSWLPLISDYTREAEKPVKASLVSALVYGVISCWMYVIGMGAAIYAGNSDIAQILLHAGLGAAGLIIVVLSTVTTTFLDAYSAGVSWETLSQKKNGTWVAALAVLLGTAGAIFFPLENMTEFLYFIGSVFAPMIAIQIADYFVLKKNYESRVFSGLNMAVWLIGFIAYRLLMRTDFVVGNTLPDMILTILLCVLAEKGKEAWQKHKA